MIKPEDIFSFVREHASGLVLPDQDVLNVLYGDRIMEIDDFIWNYDARMYSSYLMRSLGTADIAWVMENTRYCTSAVARSHGNLTISTGSESCTCIT